MPTTAPYHHLTQAPVVQVQMLIRRPVADVFAAFVDPALTTRFWFTASSGPLVAGERVRWEWAMYGVATEVHVIAVEANQRLLIEWDGPADPTSVEWTFAPRGDDATFVTIKNWGFRGDADEVVAKALDSMGGFSLVLAGLKAFLEHGIALNLVADHAPDALVAASGTAT